MPLSIAADSPVVLRTADFDGDGDLDVLSASRDDRALAWYPNAGNGRFGAQRVIGRPAQDVTSVYAVDVDGDGDPDVLTTSETAGELAWYPNDGDGVFGAPRATSPERYPATAATFADLDGDGDVDLAFTSRPSNSVLWQRNEGGGVFGPPRSVSNFIRGALGPRDVAAVDVDGDPDVVSPTFGRGEVVWSPNAGDGTFGPLQRIAIGFERPFATIAADVTGDGALDVIAASYTHDTIELFPNEPFCAPP